MSATNRGSPRSPDDFYGTPDWIVDAILPRIEIGDSVVEAGAGEGQIVSRLLAYGVPADRITAYEIDPARAEACRARCPGVRVIVGDFLTMPLTHADFVIMNPPYDVRERPGTTAFAFVQRACELTQGRGIVAALLRLNWLEGARHDEPARLGFLKRNPPDVHISPKRPAFALNKHGRLATDACAYAWMVWGQGPGGHIRWLDFTRLPSVTSVRTRSTTRPARS